MKLFRARASQAALIMANDRSGKNMGDTAKTYLRLWLKEHIYERRKEVKTKYMEKGNLNEDMAIVLAGGHFGFQATKNKERKTDDFFTGEWDIELTDEIIDIKNSWDFDTFPLFETVLNPIYYAQQQVYMHLTGKKKASVIYCLLDAPEEIIDKEARKLAWQINDGEVTLEIETQIREQMTYSNIDNKYRFKRFPVEYNPEYIKALQDRVIQCREYIHTLLPSVGYLVSFDTTLNTYIYEPIK